MQPPARRRIFVGISGSSGAIYGVPLLEVLSGLPDVETHAVISRGARATIRYETGREPDEVAALATFSHEENALGAIIASGSF